MDVKLLTINTWKCDGAYHARLAVLAQQIRALSPDVILLQEVFRSFDGQYHTLRYLGTILNMMYVFLPMRRKMRQFGCEIIDSFSGMGCLSKFPIEYMEAIPLPSNEADGGRVGQLLKIKIQEDYHLFGNVHLSFLQNSDDLKIAQLNAVLCRMAAHQNIKSYLLAGDFNSEPESRTIQYLYGCSLAEVKDTLLATEQPKQFAYTILPLPEKGDEQGKRIDYIFSLAIHGVSHLLIKDARVTLNEATNGMYPSDHFGIFAHFNLRSDG